MRVWVAAGAVGLLWAMAGNAQNIPRTEYIKYVPLHHRQLIRQTEASAQFALYGDTAAPDYVDANHDGIDDHRAQLLQAMAVRFSPFLVRNTTNIPMDWKRFITRQQSFPLFIDRWEVSGAPGQLIRSEQIDFANLHGEACGARAAPGAADVATGIADDCALLRLLAEFDPDHPTDVGFDASRPPTRDRFTVLFWNFPGDSPDAWRDEYRSQYSGRLPQRYEGFKKVYVHPFISRIPDSGPASYELVFQYWFFYPLNDGGNKHAGDWEHINVVVSPRSLVLRGLRGPEMQALLRLNDHDLDGDDPLVIKRVDHYVHNNVIVLDYARPNVYQPRAAWAAEARGLEGERSGASMIFGAIRERAYADRAETVINTHPIGYIGGDSKGLDLLLSPPGSRSRDSHATYPFPGIYKDPGPAASAEEVKGQFVIADYTGPHARPWPDRVERFDDPARLDLVPDWERVIGFIRTEPRARREYSWLVLPIRWGWPAMVSPFAGIIANAETGNLSPVGPTFSNGWNRTGAVATFANLDLQRFPSTFPLSPLDVMRNDLGFLNAPLVLLTTLPPFGLLYKGIARPIAAIAGVPTSSVFVSQAPAQFRVVGVGIGVSTQLINANTWSLLFTDPKLFNPIITRIEDAGIHSYIAAPNGHNAIAPQLDVQFYLSSHFTSENILRHARSSLGFDNAEADSVGGGPFPVRGTLNFWEYAGNLRYSILTRAIQPYVKLGYGLSWYRLEDITTDGEPLSPSDGPWIHQPSILRPGTFLPDEWSYGIGIELIPIFSPIPLTSPGVSLTLDYSVYNHPLGIPLQSQAEIGLSSAPSVRRPALSLTAVVSW